jgi:glyoxylase-like metal-dependent hydrolase (beta-lactamase superfamily II)
VSARPVAPDVWRITTPLPFRPREVHAYLLRGAGGEWVLVDGGMDSEEAWSALGDGIRSVAGPVSSLAVHVVTHMHLDHIGLAGRIR